MVLKLSRRLYYLPIRKHIVLFYALFYYSKSSSLWLLLTRMSANINTQIMQLESRYNETATFLVEQAFLYIVSYLTEQHMKLMFKICIFAYLNSVF